MNPTITVQMNGSNRLECYLDSEDKNKIGIAVKVKNKAEQMHYLPQVIIAVAAKYLGIPSGLSEPETYEL